MSRFLSRAFSFVALVALFLAPQVQAQGGQQAPPQPPEPEIEASDVTDQDLEAAANILLKINQVRAKYIPQLKQADSRKKQMQVRKQMSQEAQQIVEANDNIETERYQQVMLVARQDSTIRNRLTTLVEEKQGGAQQQQQDDS